MTEPAAESSADDLDARRGKGVQDFDSGGIVASVKRSLSLLPESRRRLFVLAAVVQISLGLLDLLGIALVGLLAAVAVSTTGLAQIPSSVRTWLDRVGLGGLTVTQLTVLFAVSAVVVLVAKTGLSAIMARRIFRFLANRQAEVSRDNRPRLNHLRESGAIEQDADVVMFVHREEYYQTTDEDRERVKGQAEIIIAKQRNGPIVDVKLLWQHDFTRFVNLEHRPYDEFEQFSSF